MDITKFVVTHRDNALLIGDYKTYQHSLTRQLATLRKKLGRSTRPKARAAAKKPITAEDIGQNHGFVHLLLVSAERAFAHAMAMKSSGTEDGTGLPGATRKHIANRVHKAAMYAEELAGLLANTAVTKATDQDLLEARAYAYMLSGAQQLEKHASGTRSSDVEAQRERWSDCLESYSAARVLYIAMFKKTRDELFKEHVASTIDPSIRFAAYQSHIPRTVPPVTVSRRCFPDDDELRRSVEELDAAAFDDKKGVGKEGAADIPSSITWRGRKANIADASIGQAITSINVETERLKSTLETVGEKEKPAAYDAVLVAAQDAADATRHAIDDHEKERIPETDQRMQDLRVTNLAINYDLIGWRVGRNRVLIGEDDGLLMKVAEVKVPSRPRKDGKEWDVQPSGNGRKFKILRDRVVLYDAILQSLESVEEVPGAMRDPTFVEELGGKKSYFRALKCLNLAYAHSLNRAYENAQQLLDRASKLTTQASDSLASSAPEEKSTPLRLDVSKPQLESLSTTITGLLLASAAHIAFQKHIANAGKASQAHISSAAPLCDSLNTYPSTGTLDLTKQAIVEYPPKLKPVPIKPLFLDTAWNYVEYPGGTPLQESVNGTKEVVEEKKEQSGGRGWFGFGRR